MPDPKPTTHEIDQQLMQIVKLLQLSVSDNYFAYDVQKQQLTLSFPVLKREDLACDSEEITSNSAIVNKLTQPLRSFQ